MAKIITRQSRWPCYSGLLTIQDKYLYSSRSGQIWRAKIPDDFPPYVYGNFPVAPVWGYREKEGYSLLPVKSLSGYSLCEDLHPDTLASDGFHFTIESGKLHVRCGEK